MSAAVIPARPQGAAGRSAHGTEAAELDALYGLVPVGLCRLDPALRVLRTNAVFDGLFGWSGTPAGRMLADCAPAHWTRLDAPIRRVLAGESDEIELDLSGAAADPAASVWRMTIRRAGDAATPLTGLLLIARDVSAKVNALARADALGTELARRVAELQAVLDLAPVPIAIARDPSCVDIELNAACARLLRVAHDENASLSRPDADALPFRIYRDGHELAPDALPMQRASATGEDIRDLEVEMVHADGSRRTLLEAASPLRDERGQVRGCVGVFLDITDRKRHELQLIDNDRRKDEFLAMLAHELRNPLAPIGHAVHMLQRLPEDASDRRRRALDLIARQVDHLRRLVDDLLDVSRITQGKVRLERAPIDLGSAIAAGIELGRPMIDQRRHRLAAQLPGDVVVDGDPVRLAQVVGNLLNNAAKYTEPGGRIRLWTERRDDAGEIDLHVRDSGMGIAPALLPRIFDLFTQDHRSLDRAEGGLGIGLSLVHRLVTLHGGRVHAASDGRGQGSQFTVTLPLSDRRPPSDADAPSHAAMPSPARRILVVDDNVDAAESLALLLELDGHAVTVAHDGPRALALADECRPDAALLDIGLPGMDGLELARHLRGRPGGERMLLVALTGYGRDQDIERSRAAGFDAHLVKPFEPDQLRELLNCIGRTLPR